MTFKQKIVYYLSAVAILLILALFDFFIFKHVINMFSLDWFVHTVTFFILVVLVNPFLALFVLNNLPFKPKGLKVDKGLKDALKKESY